MAVDHAQRARWASRVLRLRQAGINFGLADVVETGRGSQVDEEMGTHVVMGGEEHVLGPLMRSFTDLKDDDKYVGTLFDMDIDGLLKEWTDRTAAAHEQMVKDGTMKQADVDACYESQDDDLLTYLDQQEDMLGTGDWPVSHRLGHGYALSQELIANKEDDNG